MVISRWMDRTNFGPDEYCLFHYALRSHETQKTGRIRDPKKFGLPFYRIGFNFLTNLCEQQNRSSIGLICNKKYVTGQQFNRFNVNAFHANIRTFLSKQEALNKYSSGPKFVQSRFKIVLMASCFIVLLPRRFCMAVGYIIS